jgi:hypothetical protein
MRGYARLNTLDTNMIQINGMYFESSTTVRSREVDLYIIPLISNYGIVLVIHQCRLASISFRVSPPSISYNYYHVQYQSLPVKYEKRVISRLWL